MEENKNAYSEVIAVLKLLDDEKQLEALPMEMLELLKSKANPEYKPEFSKEIPIDEQNLMPETLSILSWIATKYWSEEIEKDENIENIENTENTEENISENLAEANSENIENINVEQTQEIKEESIEEKAEEQIENKQTDSNLPTLYKDLKWYQKLKAKIIEFFNRIFKRKNIEMQKSEEEGKNSI